MKPNRDGDECWVSLCSAQPGARPANSPALPPIGGRIFFQGFGYCAENSIEIGLVWMILVHRSVPDLQQESDEHLF